MKKVVLLCCVLLCFACKPEDNDLIGLCDNPIKLSRKNVKFSSDANLVKITTNRGNWWFGGVSLDEKEIEIKERHKENFKMEEEVFTIEKVSSTEFVVKMTANHTKEDRILALVIQSGNCFTYLSVTQFSEK